MNSVAPLRSPGAVIALLIYLAWPALSTAQDHPCIDPPFDSLYRLERITPPPGTHPPYGRIVVAPRNPNEVLVSRFGASSAYVVRCPVTRDSDGHIVSIGREFGNSRRVGAYVSSGIDWHSNGENYFRISATALSTVVEQWDRRGVIAPRTYLTAIGFPYARDGQATGLAFWSPGYPYADQLKVVSQSGLFFATSLLPRTSGPGFTLGPIRLAARLPAANHPSHIQGICYASGPALENHLMACHQNGGYITSYEIDSWGNPNPRSVRQFASGFHRVRGISQDPVSGDFLITGHGHRLFRVEPIRSNGQFQTYGTGIIGSRGQTSALSGVGSTRLGARPVIQMVDGPRSRTGVLNVSLERINLPIPNGHLLAKPSVVLPFPTSSSGTACAPLTIPYDPAYVGLRLYMQGLHADPLTRFGYVASNGLEMLIH